MAKVSNKTLNNIVRLLARQPNNRRRGRRRPRRQRVSRSIPTGMLSKKQVEHATLLQRPFVAPASGANLGYYSGEQGTINRFVVDFGLGTGAAQTALAIVLHPNTGYFYSTAVAASTTAITVTPAWNSTYSPGYTYLNTNASKQRALASAIKFAVPSLSVTTLTGEFAIGVVSYDTATSFTTIDQFFTHAASRANLSKDYHEVRWYPGAFDDKYSTVSASATGTDGSDTNVVFLVMRGLPASTPTSIQFTSVVEWTPKPGTGVAPSMTHSAGTNHQQTVEVLNSHTPGWHHTAKATAERLLDSTVHTLGKKAEKWVPEMLTAGLAAFGL